MTEMVVHVAQAILGRVPSGYGMTYDEALEYARAAIGAMREPTDAMLETGLEMIKHSGPSAIFRAMVDAALTVPSRQGVETMKKVEIEIFERKRGVEDPTPWRADIWKTPGGSEHHGIGKTPSEALLNAAMHWAAYENSKAKVPTEN